MEIYNYYPIYDENLNLLRDRTHEENLKLIPSLCMSVYCPCLTGKKTQLTWGSNFVNSHVKSKKHKEWLIRENDKVKQNFSGYSTSETRINKLLKDNRDLKVVHRTLLTEMDDKNMKIEKLQDQLTNCQSNSLKYKLQTQKAVKKLNNIIISNEIQIKMLIKEIQFLEQEICSLTERPSTSLINKLTAVRKRKIITNKPMLLGGNHT